MAGAARSRILTLFYRPRCGRRLDSQFGISVNNCGRIMNGDSFRFNQKMFNKHRIGIMTHNLTLPSPYGVGILLST